MDGMDLARYQDLLILQVDGDIDASDVDLLRTGITDLVEDEKVGNVIVAILQSRLNDEVIGLIQKMQAYHKNQVVKYQLVSPCIPGAFARTVDEALHKIGTQEALKVSQIIKLTREEKQIDTELAEFEQKIADMLKKATGAELELPLDFKEVKRQTTVLEDRKVELQSRHEMLATNCSHLLKMRRRLKDSEELPALNVAINAAFNIMKEKGIERYDRRDTVGHGGAA